MEAVSQRDTATGLPNRALARDRLDRLVSYANRAGSKVAVICLELDDFSALNKKLGYVAGCGLLREVSSRLQECVRETDTISHDGGGEFLILLGDVSDPGSAGRVIDKVKDIFSCPFPSGEMALSLAASIGCALYPDDGKDFDTLVSKAGIAMVHVKRQNRSAWGFYTPGMNDEVQTRLQLVGQLRQAFEAGHLTLHYQPQFRLSDGALIGAEALLRWICPRQGMVAPASFIPQAEHSGLIVPIGEWVLSEACRQAMAWRELSGTAIPVAVNVSAVQFHRGDIEAAVTSALECSGCPPALLEIELTESVLLENAQATAHVIRRLGERGVRFSIDDFGTGYSSLAYLKYLAVHKLKIDQSFVRDLHDGATAKAIVRAIIHMAQGLGLETIAEGIEDPRTLESLRHLGCDQVQGYHLGRPVPVSQFSDLFLASSQSPSGRFLSRMNRL